MTSSSTGLRHHPDVGARPRVRTLAIGDRFISASSYVEALRERTEPEVDVVVDVVDWRGDKASHHAAQQVMEHQGPNSVPVPPELLSAVTRTEALCAHFAPIGRDLIHAARSLRVIALARAGTENVDVDAATSHGVAVVRAEGRNAGAVAELQLGLMLAETRNIARADRSIRNRGWRKDFPGVRVEIADSRVGMVGFGHVGRAFARRLSGFGAALVAYDPYVEGRVFADFGVARCGRLDELFSTSDFVVVQARLTEETHRFLGADLIARMKPTAYLVNVARSRIVDMDALRDALAGGRIAGAGIDVFDEEPLPDDSAWRRLDNVTLTTHFGGDTEGTNRTSAGLVADVVLELARTGRVRGAVNADALGWT